MQAKNVVTKDLLAGRDIWIGTPKWFDWLTTNNAFRYETEKTNFNCNRRSNGKWYASKKIYATNGCKLITLYIGGAQDCNLAKLQEIAERFSMNWTDFWHCTTGLRGKSQENLEVRLYNLNSAVCW